MGNKSEYNMYLVSNGIIAERIRKVAHQGYKKITVLSLYEKLFKKDYHIVCLNYA